MGLNHKPEAFELQVRMTLVLSSRFTPAPTAKTRLYLLCRRLDACQQLASGESHRCEELEPSRSPSVAIRIHGPNNG